MLALEHPLFEHKYVCVRPFPKKSFVFIYCMVKNY